MRSQTNHNQVKIIIMDEIKVSNSSANSILAETQLITQYMVEP